MTRSRATRRLVAALLLLVAYPVATGHQGNGLLLPFPTEAATELKEPPADASVPERNDAAGGLPTPGDFQRAQELADTFIRRQQMEIANSVPQRGTKIAKVPSRAPAPSGKPPLSMAASVDPPVLGTGLSSSGPASELLPLPGEDSPGALLEFSSPNAAPGFTSDSSSPDSVLPDSANENEVPRTDLVPAPAYGELEDQARTGPVFRVSGTQAFAVARARGFRFTPAGGIGARDGAHTAASQFPNTLTSEVHGTRMSQLSPPPAWSVTETSNAFFMFCDASYNAVRLAPGWRIRGIKIAGPNWRWVRCPRSGANTASFSIRIHAFKGQDAPTSVQLAGLTLEGPEGATDWKDAFPWINGKAHARRNGPQNGSPEAQAVSDIANSKAAEKSTEPPLPE